MVEKWNLKSLYLSQLTHLTNIVSLQCWNAKLFTNFSITTYEKCIYHCNIVIFQWKMVLFL